MKVSISDLKAHVAAFVNHAELGADSTYHQLLARFAEFVEGKQAIVDATAYLTQHGYTVTAPPAPATPTVN